MREGFDHDDIYMMVEDELYSVAQTFTQHLHHAEYLRLKNLAKAKGTSNLSGNSRPTDSITKMREELKRKKQAEVQAEKHKQALMRLGGEAARKRLKLSGDERGDWETEEDDIWAGTSLKGLMTNPSKHKISLTGLQGNKSNTRAAAGFSPPKAPGSKHHVTFDVSTFAKGDHQTKRQRASSQATASDDDDDLDAPVHKPGEPPAFKSIEKDVSFHATPSARTTTTKSYGSNRPSQRLVTSAYDSKYKTTSPSPSESESDDRPTLPRLPVSRVSRPLKRLTDAKVGIRDAEAKVKNQPNVNEIPIFLV